MDEHEVKFATLHEDRSLTDERSIKQANIMACPHLIMVPEHYRQDGSCRCNDETHTEMKEWEYTWNGERWQ